MKRLTDVVPEPGDAVSHKEVVGKPMAIERFRGPFKGPFGFYVTAESWVLGKGRIWWRTGGAEVLEQLAEVAKCEAFPIAAVLREEPSRNVPGTNFQVLRDPTPKEIEALERELAPADTGTENPAPAEQSGGAGSEQDSPPADGSGSPTPGSKLTPAEYAHRQSSLHEIRRRYGVSREAIFERMDKIHAGAKSVEELGPREFEKLCEELRDLHGRALA